MVMPPGVSTQISVFENDYGLFTSHCEIARRRDVAVLFLNAWGLEGLYIQSYHRDLAEKFASIGISSLRFDFPGTGNASDGVPEEMTLNSWFDALQSAARELRRLAGTQNIVLLGHGLGASLAFLEARSTAGLAGLILMAPVLAGRRYLRDLSVMSKFIDNVMGLKAEQYDAAPGSIAGLRMAPQIAAQVKDIGLEKALPPDPKVPVLIVSQPGKPDQAWADQLREKGHSVDTLRYDGYDALVSGSLPPQLPKIGGQICAWLQGLPAYRAGVTASSQVPSVEPLVMGSAFETPVFFGDEPKFFGTVCEPVGPATGVAVLILTTGYDPQSGWARSAAELARRLAARGIASLRYDSAGVGESPAVPGRRRQILYDPVQGKDVGIAFAYLRERLRPSKTMVVGRCSGAYLAFRAAVADPGWDACVVVNPPDFRWRFRGLPRTLNAYSEKLRKRDLVKALRAGEIDARAALQNIGVRLIDRVAGAMAKVLPSAPRLARRSDLVMRDFETLARRKTEVTILYSEGDEGEGSFRIHFSLDGKKLAAFPNIRLLRIPNADHNVTPRPAREMMFEVIEQQALDLTSGTITRAEAERAGSLAG